MSEATPPTPADEPPAPPKAEPPPARVDALVCDLCGAVMYERHCRIVCQRCGYQRDCSDP